MPQKSKSSCGSKFIKHLMSSFEGIKRKGSSVPIIVLIIALVALYGFGGYNIYILLLPWLPTIETILTDVLTFALPWLAGYWWGIALFGIMIVVLGLVFGYIILRLMKRFAAGTLKVVWLIEAFGMIAIGVFMAIFLFPFGLFGLFFSLIGILQIWIWFRRRQKIERGGKLAEFTAKLLLEEREMFIVPLLMAIFSIVTSFLMIGTFALIYFNFNIMGISPDSLPFFVVLTLLEAIFIFVHFSVFYLLEGINVSIAHTWYRKEDPVLRGALSEVRQVAGTIITFAGLHTLVVTLQGTIRRSSQEQGGPLAIIGAIVSRIIGAIFRFITYFTLPAIIIEKRGLKDSIKRSATTTWKYFVDVYIAETGVSTVFSLFGALLSLGYLAGGFVFGYFMGLLISADAFFALIAGIAFAMIFIMFAAIPSYFIFRPLTTAYNTFMFAYALDEESGFKLPSRLPKEYRDAIEEAQRQWEATPSKRQIQEPPSEW